jgi:hypothetical protein
MPSMTFEPTSCDLPYITTGMGLGTFSMVLKSFLFVLCNSHLTRLCVETTMGGRHMGSVLYKSLSKSTTELPGSVARFCALLHHWTITQQSFGICVPGIFRAQYLMTAWLRSRPSSETKRPIVLLSDISYMMKLGRGCYSLDGMTGCTEISRRFFSTIEMRAQKSGSRSRCTCHLTRLSRQSVLYRIL